MKKDIAMGIEEKAKAYDEALERASRIKDNNTVATPQEVAEHIFPELRESEDERARKAALEGIEYLERKLGWDAIGDTDILDVKEYLEKQKEQKPVQSEDEREYVRILKSIVSDFIRDKKPEDVAYYQKIYDWLDGRHVEMKESNPAEWSEEDEKTLQRIIRHTESEYQDWCNDKYGNSEIVSDGKRSCLERLDWLENRFKSLRPQPHWKPSNEQINYLGAAVIEAQIRHNESTDGFPRYRVLKELYEQLLKL